jgi:hypothetical protein
MAIVHFILPKPHPPEMPIPHIAYISPPATGQKDTPEGFPADAHNQESGAQPPFSPLFDKRTSLLFQHNKTTIFVIVMNNIQRDTKPRPPKKLQKMQIKE